MTTFSKDTGMTLGEVKCRYQQVENGKLIKNTEDLKMSNLNIKPIKDCDPYKYLGTDKNISYLGTLNKERVMKEYLRRVKKNWQSELSFFKKVIAHNTFTISVLATTVKKIDWTIEEIKKIDVRTRKKLTTTRNFHSNGDVDKLCLLRSQGSPGLKMVTRMFESRVIAVAQYLKISSNRRNIIKFVYEQEQKNIIRIQQKLLEC